jgi:site-specific recombinase XerD
MRFIQAIDRFIEDSYGAGRITSPRSEAAYRHALGRHADDAPGDDPRHTTREDVRTTLRRWRHPNTQRKRHSMLSSFYRWMVHEGHRRDNPAEAIPRARRREPQVIRPRLAEALAMLMACETTRERRVISLLLLAGARNQELRGFQGRHFEREGWIWVSPDIAKGGRQRWVPVLEEARPVVNDIRATVARDEYVVPAQRRNPHKQEWYDLPDTPCSGQAIWRLVRRVADRAGVDANPHSLRRAFADLIEQEADVREAQQLLGHADLRTTQLYLSEPTLDRLQRAVAGVTLNPSGTQRNPIESPSHPVSRPWSNWTVAVPPANPVVPPRGFEPRFPP